MLQRLFDQYPAVLLEKVEWQNRGLTVDLGTEFFGELPDGLAFFVFATMRWWYLRVAAIAVAKYARTSSRPTSSAVVAEAEDFSVQRGQTLRLSGRRPRSSRSNSATRCRIPGDSSRWHRKSPGRLALHCAG